MSKPESFQNLLGLSSYMFFLFIFFCFLVSYIEIFHVIKKKYYFNRTKFKLLTMKKTFFFFFMTLMMSCNHFNGQQPSDYLFLLDNGNVSDENFLKMKNNAVKLMEQLLACNHTNRIAVVHYGNGVYGNDTGVYTPSIYIETDFTMNYFPMQNIQRRLDFGGHLNESLKIADDALNWLSNVNILSPQKTLERYNGNPLKVILFTHSRRNSGSADGSYLVNSVNTAPDFNDITIFENVVKFKNELNAEFTVIHGKADDPASEASACIASGGGSYTGPVEANIADPDSGSLSRRFYKRENGFGGLASSDSQYWRGIAEDLCNFSLRGNITFNYEPGACKPQLSGISGKYYLPPGYTLLGFSLRMINIETGKDYDVTFNPIMVPPNLFYTPTTQLSDLYEAINDGATGKYRFMLAIHYKYGVNNFEKAFSWNRYPFFDYDFDMDCLFPSFNRTITQQAAFRLTPNPTSGIFKVILNKEVKSGTLEIRDLVGNIVYNKVLRGEKEIEADLSSRKEGVYIINVSTDKNKIYSEKIIKK